MDDNFKNTKDTNVSLPGAGGAEPTILEVFNSNLVSSSDTIPAQSELLDQPPSPSSPSSIDHSESTDDNRKIEPKIDDDHKIFNSNQDKASSVSVREGDSSASNPSQQQITKDTTDTDPEVISDTADVNFKSVATSECAQKEGEDEEDTKQKSQQDSNNKVLDIESHLIETYENYLVNDSDSSGVNVSIVPPAQEELSRPSTVDSEKSIKTVIEIEPRLPILHKTVELKVNTSAQEPKLELSGESKVKLSDPEEHARNVLNTQQESLAQEVEQKNSIDLHIKEESDVLEKSKDVQIDPTSSPHIENNLEKSSESGATCDTEKILEDPISLSNVLKKSPKDEADLNSALKSPALLRLIEKSLGRTSETVNETATKNDKEQIIQPTFPNKQKNISEDDRAHELKADEGNLKENTAYPEISKKSDEKAFNSTYSLGINGLSVASPEEEEAKRSFLESIPQLEESSSPSTHPHNRYQSLREYLFKKEASPPPVPIQTYRWEDLRRAKEKGGYPWTHLYKRPLGPDEEPEIVLLLRKSQELRLPSESPRSLKKVRIHDQVLVKETERYISDLSDTEDVTEEDTRSAHSETTSLSESEDRPSKLNKIKGILKRNRPSKINISSASQDGQANGSKEKSEDSPKKAKCCHPIMDKLKIMADKQLKKRHIKKVPLKNNEKIVLAEEQKILKLKHSPKAERSEIPHFIEKRDSDEILEDVEMEIVELEESPSKARKRRELLASEHTSQTSVLVPDEIIEIPQSNQIEELQTTQEEVTLPTPEPTVSEILEEEFKTVKTLPPKKSPRKKKEHVYEDIDDDDVLSKKIDEILEEAVVSALKQSLANQDQIAINDLEVKPKLEEMGSSEETEERQMSHLAPISSIDSASSDEDRKKVHLSPLAEESDQGEQASLNSVQEIPTEKETLEVLKIVEDNEKEEAVNVPEIKSVLKRESSPSSDKKVTFSHVEDESEPHREDIELPEQYKSPIRSSKINDHEYEPIGEQKEDKTQSTSTQPVEKESSPQPIPTVQVSEAMEIDRETKQPSEFTKSEATEHKIAAEEFQRDIEDRYFSSAATTPRTESRTESRTDYIHTSQVDSSALEELPLKAENRKKGFMASAQDRSKRIQANLRSQAVKVRTKIRGIKKPPSGSPKKERRRFKAPEFSKMKMPEMKFKAPDMSKFKTPEFKKIEFKRPEFTKFNKPDMSKFKMPEKLSSLKPRRTKSLKESETVIETISVTTPESSRRSPKKMFDFNFGTYPRALRRIKKKTLTKVVTSADDIPTSSETPPSFESATIPRGARDKGPVGSRWADKFSEVSYGDSESGKYQRYESSEGESVEPRESSLERKIRENLDRVAKEDAEFGILQTEEQKQFAEFDEENRAIHEISKIRESEFKQRRPMVHQDSDLVSEESKDVGWSEKDILRNKILRQTDPTENENFVSEEGLAGSATNTNLETQSTGSSSALRQKGVIEEIDDDEFFLRKRGISQDNIEIRQYISSAIREGFETPINALAKLGSSQDSYPDEMVISSEQVDYGYDVPPPKPRRLKHYNNFDRNIDSEEVSQEFDVERKENYDDNISLPQTGSDYFKQLPPNRPLRRSKKHYSEESQEVPDVEIPYFDDEQISYKRDEELNNLGRPPLTKVSYDNDDELINQIKSEPPKAPKRRKKQLRESSEKDSYLNGFTGRSISNSYLPEDNQQEVIVYRTEHQYVIPLAKPEQFTPLPTPPRSSRSISRVTDDDRTSHGADSYIFNEDEHFKVEMKENDGYAVVKKEPPPRPPAPVRRKRSSNSFDYQQDRRFATMPHMRKDSPVPQPKRNYSTVSPLKPPRRRSSVVSVDDTVKDTNASDATQYEEVDADVDDFERTESPRNLQSGDIISKMKDRPLPPPPRPPREHKKFKNITDRNNKGEGAEKIISEILQNGDYEVDKSIEKCIEVEVSTQTDPLPDDFECEEFEITDDMKIIEPRRPKTLEDILREEEEKELERAIQQAEEETLSRGIQRFRDSSQRTYSERSRGSADRSRGSRPPTPSAILIERRVPTPLPYLDQTLLAASLIVQPVDDDEIIEKLESEPALSEKKSERSEERSDAMSEDRLEDQAITSDTGSQFQEEEERLNEEDLIRKLSLAQKEDEEYKPKSIEEENLEQLIVTPVRSVLSEGSRHQDELLSEPESPPQPPPRRRSSGAITIEQTTVTENPITSTQLLPISELSAAPVQAVMPNRLAVADLEVERLSVQALQAAQITVSQLQGSLISADDLDCKSGNLVVRNLELPPGLIEEIVERVRSSERTQSQAQTQTTESEEKKLPTSPEEPPVRPPPPSQHQIFPSEYMQYSIPPPSFYQLRSPTDEDIPPLQTHRRRRHYRRRDSSSEDESYRERRRSRQATRSPEPTIGEIGGQLVNACGTSVLRTMTQILNYLRATEKEGAQRSNISTAIIIIILATLGFLLLGLSGKNIHHHHWDFFNLPGNDGRGK